MNFNKQYKSFKLNVSELEFDECGLLLVNGASGSGKSTLLKLIFSYFKKKKKTVFMRPDNIFYKNQNVSEVIEISSQTNGKEEYFYSSFEIESMLEKKIKNLSGGEKRRLYFYLVAMTDSQVYIFDEPFSGVDENMREIQINLLKNLSKHAFVIVATHHDNINFKHDRIELYNGVIKDKTITKTDTKIKTKNELIVKKYTKKRHFLLWREILNVNLSLIVFLFFLILTFTISASAKNVYNMRIASDNLNLFNSRSTINVKPSDQSLIYSEVDLFLDTIVENESNLIKKDSYSIASDNSSSMYIGIDGTLPQVSNPNIDLSSLYGQSTEIEENGEYILPKNSQYLRDYFTSYYGISNSDELNAAISSYNYESLPLTLQISVVICGENYTKSMIISGITEEIDKSFYGKESLNDFITSLFQDVSIKNLGESYDRNEPTIIKNQVLECQNNAPVIANYLNLKYNEFVFTYETNNTLYVSKSKNVKNEEYYQITSNFDDCFAYSFSDSYFALKNSDFFSQNFSYLGSLNITEGEIIVSGNYITHNFEVEDDDFNVFLAKQIEINERIYTIKGILDQTLNEDVYFTLNDYENYIAPSYNYSLRMYISEYEKMADDIIFLSSVSSNLSFSSEVYDDLLYNEAIASLIAAKDSYVLINVIVTVAMLVFVVFFLMMCFFNLYINYIKLASFKFLKINLVLFRIVASILAFIVVLVTATIFEFISTNIVYYFLQSRFSEILYTFGLTAFSLEAMISSFNYLYLLPVIPLIILAYAFTGDKVYVRNN